MTDVHAVARDQLRAFIERIERLESEKKTIADDIKDVYGEAKGTGFDTKVLRKLISIRKQDRDERMEQEAILDMYMIALGMIDQPADYDEPRQSSPVQRQPAMAMRSDAGLNIVTKHTEITNEGNSNERDSQQHVGRPHDEQHDEAPVSGPDGRGEGADAGAEGQGSGASGSDRSGGAVAGTVDREDKDGRSRHVGSEARHEITPSSDSHAANAGGNDVDRNAERVPTSNTGEGAASALPASGTVIESVPPAPMKRPDFATCFPELSNAAYAHLHDEIQASGICAPIVRHGEVILDGWDRYNISRELGFDYPVEIYHGSDVLLDVIGWQRASRNFTPAQEKKIAADLAKDIPHRADDIMAAFGLAEALEAAE